MPSKSPAQARLMAAVAHNPAFAKRVGVPQSVGKEFNEADAGTGVLSGKRKRNKSTGGLHVHSSMAGAGLHDDRPMRHGSY